MARKKVIAGVDPEYLEKQRTALLRRNRHVLLFNDHELAAIDEYCALFGVKSRTRHALSGSHHGKGPFRAG